MEKDNKQEPLRGEEEKDGGGGRRDFLKRCALWLAGNFVLLNGVIFSRMLSANAQPGNPNEELESLSDDRCGVKEDHGHFYFADEDCGKGTPPNTDLVCGKPIRGQAPFPGNATWDLDCGKTISPGVVHGDSDCGLQHPTGGTNLDEDCGKATPWVTSDSACGLRIAGHAYWSDDDCGKVALPSNRTWPDNSCDLAWWKDIF